MKQKVLFIDRDGTLILEPPIDFQVDSLEKLDFYPKVFKNLSKIAEKSAYKLVMVTNQDGLGTDSFPEEDFIAPHNKMLKAFEGEGIIFDEILIDKSFPHENSPNRKPEIGLLKHYLNGDYDIENSFVIGDRYSDVQLAKNIGAKSVWMTKEENIGEELSDLKNYASLISTDWEAIVNFVLLPERIVSHKRETKETKIAIKLNLDGKGTTKIKTGLNFFDHMLEQIGRHSGIDLEINCEGDLHVDEHHTIEDTAITLGEAFKMALGNKLGMERYGFALPMDDCQAKVLLDFGGRNWLMWKAGFQREKIGDMPTEMFFHFFKSFADHAQCNLNIEAKGMNEHHKIEAIFKCFAKALKMAIKREPFSDVLPSTK